MVRKKKGNKFALGEEEGARRRQFEEGSSTFSIALAI
jgi:hypothetical protein